MLELLVIALYCWLFFKALGLAFRLAWGTAKIIASILFAIAWPLLIGCVLFAGGAMLLLPLLPVAAAFVLLKACVS